MAFGQEDRRIGGDTLRRSVEDMRWRELLIEQVWISLNFKAIFKGGNK